MVTELTISPTLSDGYAESAGPGAAYKLLSRHPAFERYAHWENTKWLCFHIIENKTDGMNEVYVPLGCNFDENCNWSRWCDGCTRGCKSHVIAPLRNERTAHSLCPFLSKPSLRYRQKSGSCNARRAHLFDLLRSTARQPFERNKDFNSNCEPERPEKAEDLDNP